MRISVFITTASSVATQTLKTQFLNMCYCLVEGQTEEELWTCFET